ncbi:hypothetical protein Hanom_Chr12g01068841 [Helianthus anomalus]
MAIWRTRPFGHFFCGRLKFRTQNVRMMMGPYTCKRLVYYICLKWMHRQVVRLQHSVCF